MIKKALINTEGKANIKIWVACFLKMYQSELKAPSKIKGGKKIRRMPCGLISEMIVMDYPMIPRLSAKNPRAILTMKSVGVYGMNLKVFCICLMMTAIVREKKKKSKASAYMETYP
jgi:hypothetical protein